MSTHENDDRRPFALVVDDDIVILLNSMDILAEAGFRPLEAHNVDAAEVVLTEYADEIVLLFTDVQMPGARNGFDLARLTSERWPEIGIMVSSGIAKPADGEMPAGAMFVTKPFSADVIYARLQELLPEGEKPEPLRSQVRPHQID